MSPLLADLVLAAHVLIAAYNVLGLAVVWIGAMARWRFVGNRWFRGTHLAGMGIVVVEALLGLTCPLTVWENQLRVEAGQGPYAESFLSHWAERFFYFDGPPELFTAIYLTFFGLMVLSVWLVPVRWRER
ncbi:MAG: DUF2784 domain-containing protein [Pseudodesulfovibrio sp.]|uniref:Transmembrane protein n=1 Tax=Pseudodesulfovibrio aespoeensis (strain ATCC 700646 / DSM 10631 / Aspo-2) TaxID=643562 RepID=E6VUF6_PSEA9|nr:MULTISPECIES: DUF2784 domain-containing protein [Pseudodesulfovibrio]MBU4193107.1 DUF2784 domain-containing protein [Pseudomonadota bacterium]ADU61101.1 Protein of unknown function DUF2784 [Pseudodesulfovibrio aespoeensis Aspo-2]MBU4244119.1 DUF2784 domain-containing protein [Pseudomonadota bacterium]MBU4378723.1 DUF2784 domain-containing protein [Pseudomonadota bacterium]MBU4476480.1 DUF2784 domain-containing protein [Pseudomonadota bacterium]